jgi:hypothetical protein
MCPLYPVHLAEIAQKQLLLAIVISFVPPERGEEQDEDQGD